jgi:hypothetical protein
MDNLEGMTVNERLVKLGLVELFDQQVNQRNKKGAVDILLQAKFSPKQAEETINAIFANPGKYRY